MCDAQSTTAAASNDSEIQMQCMGCVLKRALALSFLTLSRMYA